MAMRFQTYVESSTIPRARTTLHFIHPNVHHGMRTLSKQFFFFSTRERGPFHQSITAILTEEKREDAVY